MNNLNVYSSIILKIEEIIFHPEDDTGNIAFPQPKKTTAPNPVYSPGMPQNLGFLILDFVIQYDK